MSIVCGLDLHRGQVTFDSLEVETGEVWRGRIWSPDRYRFRHWLEEELGPRANGGRVDVVVEGCTGWRYVAEEVTAAGFVAHVAEPAETQARRGRKKRAKTDRSDARLQRELLVRGELPESWIPPLEVLEWRERARLYKSLLDQRTQWVQRIHAELFHQGVPVPDGEIRTDKTRAWLTDPDLEVSPAGRQRIAVAYRMITAIENEQLPLRRDLTRFGMRQPACRALVQNHYGVGGLVAVMIWSGRLPAILAIHASSAPRWPGRDRRSVRHSPSGWQTDTPGSADFTLGSIRSGQGFLASNRTRQRVLRQSEGRPQRQGRRAVHCPQPGPPLLPHASCRRSRPGLRRALADRRSAGHCDLGRPDRHHNPAAGLQPTRCTPAPCLDGPRTLRRPRSHPSWVTQSKMLSPTTPSSSSTQVTLSALTTQTTGHGPLTGHTHTGNARTDQGRPRSNG